MPSEIEQLKTLVKQLQEENSALREENRMFKSGGQKPEIKEVGETDLENIIRLANIDNDFENSHKGYREDWETNSLKGVYRKKVDKLGIVNYMERRRDIDKNITPEYSVTNDGEYLGVETNGRYITVPRAGKTYDQFTKKVEAMDEVFEISPESEKFNPSKIYIITKIIKPAIFEKDESGRLSLIEKGEIVLKEKS